MRVTVLALSLVLLPASAVAQRATYRGPHPIDLDGHWHEQDEPHEHGELVVGTGPFGEAGGVRLFLGDPIAFGWDGEIWMFRGAHPLPGGIEGYCGLSGDHRHPFAPEGRFRRHSNGAHIYIGGMRGGVPMARPARTVPRNPIVSPPAVASPAPYWFWGCQYQLLPGTRGGLLPTPLLSGCVPRSPGRRGGFTGARGTRRDTAPPSGSWYDGNYGGIRSVPGRGARPAPPSTQRR